MFCCQQKWTFLFWISLWQTSTAAVTIAETSWGGWQIKECVAVAAASLNFQKIIFLFTYFFKRLSNEGVIQHRRECGAKKYTLSQVIPVFRREYWVAITIPMMMVDAWTGILSAG